MQIANKSQKNPIKRLDMAKGEQYNEGVCVVTRFFCAHQKQTLTATTF